MIEYYNGDIFKAPINILIHSANCFHTMGAGIAKDIKLKYPRAYAADCLTVRGDRKKLGQFSVAMAGTDQPFHICNLYTQHRYGRDQQYVEYPAFFYAIENVKNWAIKMEKFPVIGCPYLISCCNAGGTWKEIYNRLDYVFNEDNSVKLLICKKE